MLLKLKLIKKRYEAEKKAYDAKKKGEGKASAPKKSAKK